MATKNADSAEAAVRAYLEWLTRGTDTEAAQAVKEQLEAAKDPIEQVKLTQQLIDLESGTKVKAGFLEHAAAWAEANGISADALRRLNVPGSILADAGLQIDLPHDEETPVARSPRISREQVVETVLGFAPGERITAPILAEVTGASTQTATAVLKKLVGEALTEPEPDPDHTGRGRAALVYYRT